MRNYEQVLQQVRYRNWHTSNIFDRKFRIKCSELNGRYTSNDFNLEVSTAKMHFYQNFPSSIDELRFFPCASGQELSASVFAQHLPHFGCCNERVMNYRWEY